MEWEDFLDPGEHARVLLHLFRHFDLVVVQFDGKLIIVNKVSTVLLFEEIKLLLILFVRLKQCFVTYFLE